MQNARKLNVILVVSLIVGLAVSLVVGQVGGRAIGLDAGEIAKLTVGLVVLVGPLVTGLVCLTTLSVLSS